MHDRPDWDNWILQKNAEHEAEELKKSDNIILEKGAARTERRAAKRGAADAAKKAKEAAMQVDPVHAISHAKADVGHGYTLHHEDLKTGKVTSSPMSQGDTMIRNKKPDQTHLIHHKGNPKGTLASKETADACRKKGTFNHSAYLAGGTGAEDAA